MKEESPSGDGAPIAVFPPSPPFDYLYNFPSSPRVGPRRGPSWVRHFLSRRLNPKQP